MNFSLTNNYQTLPDLFYKKAEAASFPKARLLMFNDQLAQGLGFPLDTYSEEELAQLFSGQKLLPGSDPVALAYAGFQFGHAVESLGDGRALLLGELNGFDVQLKGSGQTPFSRRGDGLSALGPVVREYIVSEAMNRLGVPTTRALAMVGTGEEVYRQFGMESGGVFTRVAPSHIRVGTFQYFYFRNDLDSIKALFDYTINRHYPELKDLVSSRDKAIGLLLSFAKRQGDLIAQWTSLGFIHGVMNTDNCSLGGFTIDYGPCAFMDEFSFHKVFSSIDERGRYSFFNQVPIIQWNVLRLADTLLPLISDNQDEAIKIVEKEIVPILLTFPKLRMEKLGKKLGIDNYQDSDEALVMAFLTYLEEESLDFTLGFRNLPDLYHGNQSFYPQNKKLESFLTTWKSRVKDVGHLNTINPIYIPRNHLVQKAIDFAYKGDMSFTKEFMNVLSDPFVEKEEFAQFSLPPKKEERVERTFCGT
jgi:uncharacterized protein YdiU (UPF0061 family)